MWKVDLSTWHDHGTKKISESLTGIEPMPWPPEHWVGALSTVLGELMESKIIELSSYVTSNLHTARISTLKVIVSGDKWIKLVNYKLSIHLSLLTMTSIVLILAVCNHRPSHANSVKWPCSPWVLGAQWIECVPSILEVMVSIPVGYSDFFFVPHLSHADQFTFYKAVNLCQWSRFCPNTFQFPIFVSCRPCCQAKF